MPETILDDALDVPFTFRRRPRALACSMRPGWRLHVLVLILNQCRGARASLEQLHVLNWAIRTVDTRQHFLQFLEGKRAPNQIIVRYDPSLSRAIDFAFSEKLVIRQEQQVELLEIDHGPKNAPPYRLVLGERGTRLLQQIQKMEDTFTVEKAFLKAIGKKLTQEQVSALFTWSPIT
jgi:hypothetical protein